MQQQAPQPAAPPAAAASVAPPVSAAAAGSSSASHPVDEMTCNFRQYLLRPIMSYGTPAHVPAGGPSPAAAPPQPVSIGLPSVDEIESFDPAAQPELFALYTRIRSHRGLPHTPEIKLEDIAAVWHDVSAITSDIHCYSRRVDDVLNESGAVICSSHDSCGCTWARPMAPAAPARIAPIGSAANSASAGAAMEDVDEAPAVTTKCEVLRCLMKANDVMWEMIIDPSVQLRRNFQELMTDCGLDIPSYSLRAAGRVPNAAVEAQLKELQHRAKVNVTMIFDARSRLRDLCHRWHSLAKFATVEASDGVLYTAMLYPSQSHVDSYLKLQWHFLSAAPDGRGVLIAFTCLNISALPLELIDILLFVEGGEDVTVVELECVLDGQKEEAEDGSGHRHLEQVLRVPGNCPPGYQPQLNLCLRFRDAPVADSSPEAPTSLPLRHSSSSFGGSSSSHSNSDVTMSSGQQSGMGAPAFSVTHTTTTTWRPLTQQASVKSEQQEEKRVTRSLSRVQQQHQLSQPQLQAASASASFVPAPSPFAALIRQPVPGFDTVPKFEPSTFKQSTAPVPSMWGKFKKFASWMRSSPTPV